MAIGGANASKPSGSTAWIVTSDDRVKQNVSPYTAGLEQVCRLKPIMFEYNGEGGTNAAAGQHVGLSAQNTQPVMSELVVKMPPIDGGETLPNLLGIDVGPLTMALVNSCQELATRLAAVEAKMHEFAAGVAGLGA